MTASLLASTLLDAHRIVILGCPGSGKTTLSRTLRDVTGRPMVHLDDQYWGPQWRRTLGEDWVRRQEELTATAEWIIEGNYQTTVELRARRAEVVLILDADTLLCLRRVLRRTHRIRSGDVSSLPLAVRSDPPGTRRATADLPGLLRKVLFFRRRDFWRMLDTLIGARGGDLPLIVAVLGSHQSRRVKSVRRGLSARQWAAAHVVRLDDLVAALATVSGS